MAQYQCHKKVWAWKIMAIIFPAMPGWKGPTCKGCFAFGSACGKCERCEWERSNPSRGATLQPEPAEGPPVLVSGDFMAKHKPEAGGYYVVYEDGYTSFSPAEAFEAGYTRL